MSPANSFGRHFICTTFGESHGPALGCVLQGCPAGVIFRADLLDAVLARRRPGGALVSARQEQDQPEILSGVYEGLTLGTPIAVIVRNQDARSEDYKDLAPRPGHADDTWRQKFGHVDPRGGGRSSGRETLARVIGGAFAQMMLSQLHPSLRVQAWAHSVGPFELTSDESLAAAQMNDQQIDEFPARFPSSTRATEVHELLTRAKAQGQSFGGRAQVLVQSAPAGLGQPVFRKLKADLASAYLGVGATIGVEMGEGDDSADQEGSEYHRREELGLASPYGGIRGGISTGQDIVARVSFKPTSSVLEVAKRGRHDPCIVPRALPVLEAMTWLCLADQVLWSRLDRVG